MEALMAYGGPVCKCCGENDPVVLTLDHVNNDGKRDRETQCGTGSVFYYRLKAKGWPQTPELQVLCWNCNMAKKFNGGAMPLWRDKHSRLEEFFG